MLDRSPSCLCPSATAGEGRRWGRPHHFLSPLQLVLDPLLVTPAPSVHRAQPWAPEQVMTPLRAEAPGSRMANVESAHTPATVSSQACNQGPAPGCPPAGWGSGKGMRKTGRALGLGGLCHG